MHYTSDLKFERGMCDRMGVLVAHEWMEITTFERSVLIMLCPEVQTYFSLYEVSADFIAEVPPCLMYCELKMMEDSQSPNGCCS